MDLASSPEIIDMNPVPQPRRIINEFKVNIIDAYGCLESKTLNKNSIVKLTHLNSRDIRVHLPNQPPGLFIGDHCIVINIFYVKVIIMYDRIIIYELDGNPQMQALTNQIKERTSKELKEAGIPYEFFMFEMIFADICQSIQQQYQNLKGNCEPLLHDLLNFPTQKKSRELLPIKNDLKKLEVAVKNIYDSLDDLLENSNDMKNMYLTNKRSKSKNSEDQDHSDVEDLLETYYFEISKVLDKLNIMENNINETDDTVLMMLDISRNRIMISDMWINFLTLVISFGTYVAGLFGMNLKNHHEQDQYTMIIVSSVLSAFILIASVGFYFRVKNVKV